MDKLQILVSPVSLRMLVGTVTWARQSLSGCTHVCEELHMWHSAGMRSWVRAES